MSIVASRSSSRSYSSRSGVGSSGLSSTGGIQFSNGLGSVARRVYTEVRGGYGTRISQSSFSMDGPGQITISANEKHTMQNLNDRLATYLEKLELQIKEFYEMRSPTHKKDLSGFYATIADIRNKIHARSVENSQMILRVDNARLAADDFKMKLEKEANMRMTMERDVARLRGVLDSFTHARGDLEMQIEGLKEELVYLRKNHEEVTSAILLTHSTSRNSSRSYSSCSGVGSSGLSSAGGMQFSNGLGSGRSRMSVSSLGSSRAPSVYGGVGGYGTRISQSSFSMDWPGQITFSANEKHTMQNLNDRLATYLEKVHSLEAANSKLELQIKEFYEMRSPTHKKDLSGFYATIADIRNKIHARSMENSQMILWVDNARLAADDFKMKLEKEANMRMTMEGDVARLRGVLDSFTHARGDLEMQIEGLKEELVYLRKNHEEEMHLMRTQQCGAVNVEMDCSSSVDMSKVLEEMRTQYEGMVEKNQRDAAKWFESKVEVLQNQITTSTTEVKTSQSQVTDLKRTFQSLEIELHGLLTQGYLEQSVTDINGRYGSQLSQLQVHRRPDRRSGK
ncbi:unnamed protein product [Coregonus sp. 'balchen']|nr:unnamed protein product [Coregonus sp. 'balchen']